MKKGNGRRSWNSPPKSDSGGGEEWLMTYADSITLLMAFFVMLFSISKLDHKKFIEITAAIEKELGQREPGTKLSPNTGGVEADVDEPVDEVTDTTDELQQKVEEMEAFTESLQMEGILVERRATGFEIELSSQLLYVSGSAELRKEVKGVLTDVGGLLKGLEPDAFSIEVQGHTDSTPIRSSQYASNWELSAARATGVVRFFIEQGLESSQLRATAFADTQPKKELAFADDPRAEEVAAMNRRVVIRVTLQDDSYLQDL